MTVPAATSKLRFAKPPSEAWLKGPAHWLARTADWEKAWNARRISLCVLPGVRIQLSGMPISRKTRRKSVVPSLMPMAATMWISLRRMSSTRARTAAGVWRVEFWSAPSVMIRVTVRTGTPASSNWRALASTVPSSTTVWS